MGESLFSNQFQVPLILMFPGEIQKHALSSRIDNNTLGHKLEGNSFRFDADDWKLSGLCTLTHWFNPVISMKSNANTTVELMKSHKPSQ